MIRKTTFIIALVSFLLYVSSAPVGAASPSEWQAGNIISDSQFMDGTSMSTAEIQTFLGKQLPSCDVWGVKPSEFGGGTRAQYAASVGNPAPFTCLTGYYEVPKTSPGAYLPENNYGRYNSNGTPYVPPGSRSAAQLISDAAQRYSISPKALLIKLATESAGPLTSDQWPLKKQYYYAMGAHCPDSGPGGSANCDINYSGFSMQIAESAKLLRSYLDNMTQSWWTYKKPFKNNSILWNVVERNCGAGNVYIESKATAALYTYTPYQPNQAALNNLYGTGDNCSAYGNRNFWRVWTDWFGSTQSGNARLFRSTSSSQVYTVVDAYKISIPSMALLQDYGFDPASIAVFSDSYVNSISSPPVSSGVSSTLGYVIKSPSDSDADGGAAYLVSRGKKYTIQSMDQFYAYGLKEADITYLPLSFVQSMPGSSNLSNYAQMPDGAINYVSANTKQLILDYPTFVTVNPSGSFTPLSEGTVATLSVGNPLTSTVAAIKKAGDPAVYIYSNGKYDLVPSMDAYLCIGIGSIPSIALSTLPTSRLPLSIVSTSTVSCLASHNGNSYVMSNDKYNTLPNNYGIAPLYEMSDALFKTLDQRQNVGDLAPYIKSSSPAIWRIRNGVKEMIPSYQNYANFGSPKFSSVSDQVTDQINNGGLALADGTILKSPSSAAIYVVNQNKRYVIPSIAVFNGSGFRWDNLETYADGSLSNTPIGANTLVPLIGDSSGIYVISNGKCFTIPSTLQADFGVVGYTSPYGKSAFRSIDFAKCETASRYIKSNESNTVYRVSNNKLRPVSSWAALVNDTSTPNPPILSVPNEIIARYEVGAAI